jgi:hypothetical protein
MHAGHAIPAMQSAMQLNNAMQTTAWSKQSSWQLQMHAHH